MSSNCNEHSLRPNNGLKKYSDERKDMPPTDIPDVTEDVVNALQSHIPCVTEDVVNVLPSPTANSIYLGKSDATGDVVNVQPSHVSAGGGVNTNSRYLGESDATGDVVNVQPSPVSAGGVVNTNSSQSDDKSWTRISKSELSLLKKDAEIGKLIRRGLSQKNM